MTKQTALGKLFTQTDGKVIYNHSTPMKVSIFKKYETYGMYRMEDAVTVLGIMNIHIDGKDYGYNLPGLINTQPTTVESTELNGHNTLTFTYNKGDTFIEGKQEVVEDNTIAYAIFQMFIFEGLRYPWMTNDNVARIFDYIDLCGFRVPDIHPVFYSVFTSELHRDPKHPTVLARHTDLKGPILPLGMKNVKLTASKLTTKLGGSYMRDTMKVALLHESKRPSELEDILRM